MGLALHRGVNGEPLFLVRIKASTKNVYGIGLVGQCASEERRRRRFSMSLSIRYFSLYCPVARDRSPRISRVTGQSTFLRCVSVDRLGRIAVAMYPSISVPNLARPGIQSAMASSYR